MTEPPSAREPVVHRRAARVILLDPADRVLLVHGFDPAQPLETYWYTIGGGVEDGEESFVAALRETYEETGLALRPHQLVGPVHQDQATFGFDGLTIHQSQEYFIARVAEFVPDRTGWEDAEVRSTVSIEWVPVPGIPDLHEKVYPAELAEIVARFRATESAR